MYLLMILAVIFLPGCTSTKSTPDQASPDLADLFPVAGFIPGWDVSQKVDLYGRDNLYSLVDGQADSFFAYGFEQVAVQRYRDSAGVLLNVEIWQLADPQDAFGLFSTSRPGTSFNIGNAGDLDPGRRLAFWQERYFVSLEALQPIPDASLQAFGRSIADKLPSGGVAPALLQALPRTGLVEDHVIFFHEEISIQMEIWLGGENILGLSQATDGVLGRYQSDDGTFRLMLVEYPTPSQAAAGWKSLQDGNVNGLAASDVNGKVLGAIFGKIPTKQAKEWLQDALK